MSDAQNTATLVTAREDLKSARGLVRDAAHLLHFDARQFSRLVLLSNELATEIENLGQHLGDRKQANLA
jgi:hypothetical protein